MAQRVVQLLGMWVAAVPVPRDTRVKSLQAAMAAPGLRLRSLGRLSPTLAAAAAPKWLTLL